ncbi:MAG: hypothetical protein ACK42G_07715, partial [Candidatus Kapaibacteriota bacterium]
MEEEKQLEYQLKQEQLKQEIEQTINDIEPVLRIALDAICKRLPNPIPLSDIESKAFSKSFELVARKHFEKFIE